ncbi:hypothetical protein E2C01_071937 [Portunus trituberculatus]|uniref:Transposable element P transposase-like GTP-binding insertion domain-containing protein n=1 Tax=Portunus trituberculatus TaxID=210409 RepID=A0A5B7I573_PORTR|nr:hypothetical protein [Portunus trituberculatus]
MECNNIKIHGTETMTYNMATDTCEGTENLGEFGMSNKAANYAIVFMVLSRTVAAGVFTHASLGILLQEAVHTGEFIHKMDQLFDTFNSSSKFHYKEAYKALIRYIPY